MNLGWFWVGPGVVLVASGMVLDVSLMVLGWLWDSSGMGLGRFCDGSGLIWPRSGMIMGWCRIVQGWF